MFERSNSGHFLTIFTDFMLVVNQKSICLSCSLLIWYLIYSNMKHCVYFRPTIKTGTKMTIYTQQPDFYDKRAKDYSITALQQKFSQSVS